MVFGKLFDKWASGRQDKELSGFLLLVKAADSSELGAAMAMATHQRHRIELEYGYNLLDPIIVMSTSPEAAFQLSSETIRMQKNGQLTEAAGMMVWVHTLRAAARLELRQLGRDLWRELARGFPHVEDSAEGIAALTGVFLNTHGAAQFPVGLTPDPT